MNKRITIAGMGYVGLTMAACLSEKGFKTVGIEVDSEKLDSFSKGKTTIYEPFLEDMIRKNLSSGNLSFSNDYEVLKDSNITFMTVGTPSKINGSIDLKQVKSTSESIGKVLRSKRDYHLVVVRSTVIPGTTNNLIKNTISNSSNKTYCEDFGLCVNPEFLKEGSAIHDMKEPDRIIIGESDKKAGQKLEDFYTELYTINMPNIFRTSLENAEMIKYVNNSFLATKISFINSIANLCEQIPNCDVTTIAKAIGLDPRIGPLFLRAGLGWGGSCLPKDLKAFMAFAKNLNVELPLISAAHLVNEEQPMIAVQKAKQLLKNLKGKKFAILGLAFKPNTDDMREAVSIKIIKKLLAEGAQIQAYDPVAINNARKIFGEKVVFTNSAKECIENTDCCIIVTEWEEFKELDPNDFRTRMRTPILIDGRRIYDPNKFADNVKYQAIGYSPS